MAVFDYTLPSGSQFRLEAPADTTRAQADRVFYEQVAAGAFIGYEIGQTLTSAEATVINFDLSRLERGTAGVDNSPILAINQSIDLQGIIINFTNQGLSIPPGQTQGSIQGTLASILNLPVPVSIPNLENTPLTNPIDEVDIVNIVGDDLAPSAVVTGTVSILTEYQTQKLLAQTAKLVDQDSDQITIDKGIGRYGFTAYALEKAGYVKPGTSQKYFSLENSNFVEIMSSPSVWTGRNGVYSLDELLNDSSLQNQIQIQLMQQSCNDLVANGIIITTPSPSIQVSTGQVYTGAGLQSTQTLVSLGLLGTNLSTLAPETQLQVINSPVLASLFNATTVDLNTIASGAVNRLSGGLTNIVNTSNAGIAFANQITGGVGALLVNASKFGTEAASLWAKASSLQGININSISTNLTNLFPPNLNNLTKNLDIFGKASSFATNFANPLGSLNNIGGLVQGQIGQLTGQLTGQIGALTSLPGQLAGQLTGQIGQLTGQLTGQIGALTSLPGQLAGQLTGQLSGLTNIFGNLGSLSNIASLGSLFGGGGDLVSGTKAAGGFNNTVNRATLDAAFARVVGSAKVPLPVFQYPSLDSLAPRLDILQAQNFLKNLPTSGGGTFGQTVTI